MTKQEYMMRLEQAYTSGRIDGAAYDAGVINADIFCDDDEEDNRCGLPSTYAEIEYSDMDSKEAYEGCRFDDMNFMRYTER